MNQDLLEKGKRLALEHTEWFTEVVQQIYYDAFVHGFKHGVEEALRGGGDEDEDAD